MLDGKRRCTPPRFAYIILLLYGLSRILSFDLFVAQVPKQLLLDLATLDLPLDNYEGMALGPRLADGRRTLLLVNDDNFSSHQIGTQFILLALDLDEE